MRSSSGLIATLVAVVTGIPSWGTDLCVPRPHPGGTVVAGAGPAGRTPPVGDGKWDEDGDKRIPLDVSEGDTVLYSKYGGTEVKVDGDDLLVLRESDVLAIVQ